MGGPPEVYPEQREREGEPTLVGGALVLPIQWAKPDGGMGSGYVDASMAPGIQALLDAGYRTNASHSGLQADHPGRPPSSYGEIGYLAFPKLGNGPRRSKRIREVGEALGFEVRDGNAYFEPTTNLYMWRTADGTTHAEIAAEAGRRANEEIGFDPDEAGGPRRDDWWDARERIIGELEVEHGGLAFPDEDARADAWQQLFEALLDEAPPVYPEQQALWEPETSPWGPTPPLYPPSQFLALPKSGKLKGPATKALEAVDGLIHVPEMPGPIPVKATAGKNTRGGFFRRSEPPTVQDYGWTGPTVEVTGFGSNAKQRKQVISLAAKRADELQVGDEVLATGGYRKRVTAVHHLTDSAGRPKVEVTLAYGLPFAKDPDDLYGFDWRPEGGTPPTPKPAYPVDIRVSVAETEGPYTSESTLVHEVAHYIDAYGFREFDLNRGFASAHAAWRTRDKDARMESLRLATVGQSKMAGVYQEYERDAADLSEWYAAVMATPEVEALQSNVSYSALETHKYLLSPQELWARSFAQWVALRGDDPALKSWLEQATNVPEKQMGNKLRFDREQHKYVNVPVEVTTPPSRLYRQWRQENFEPVAAAMDDLFESLGWSRGSGTGAGRERDGDSNVVPIGRAGERRGGGGRSDLAIAAERVSGGDNPELGAASAPILAADLVPTAWQVEHGYAEIKPGIGFRTVPYKPIPGGRTENDALRMMHHFFTGKPEEWLGSAKGGKAQRDEVMRDAVVRWREHMEQRGWTWKHPEQQPLSDLRVEAEVGGDYFDSRDGTRMEGDDANVAFQAFDGDRMIGTLWAEVPDGSERLWVWQAWVEPEYRHKGVTKALLRAAREEYGLPIRGFRDKSRREIGEPVEPEEETFPEQAGLPEEDTFVGIQGFERGPGRVRIEGERPRLATAEVFDHPFVPVEEAVPWWDEIREREPVMEEVDLADLVPTQDLMSKVRVAEYAQELAEDGDLDGLLSATRVAVGVDGRLYLADGHNRVAAARQAGHTRVRMPVLRPPQLDIAPLPADPEPDFPQQQARVKVGVEKPSRALRDELWEIRARLNRTSDEADMVSSIHAFAGLGEPGETYLIARDDDGKIVGAALVVDGLEHMSARSHQLSPPRSNFAVEDDSLILSRMFSLQPGTGRALLTAAGRHAGEQGRGIYGGAIREAVGFYKRMGMSVDWVQRDLAYVRWTPEQTKRLAAGKSLTEAFDEGEHPRDPRGRWARASFTRMARTGVPEIDATIDAYAQKNEVAEEGEDRLVPLAAMKDPYEAEGFCSIVSKDFAAFAQERGLTAYDSGKNVNAPGYAHPGNPLLGTAHDAEAFGYKDRTRTSEYDEHSATVIEHGGRTFVVDWAAAQYGYSEFPMVMEATPRRPLSEAAALMEFNRYQLRDRLGRWADTGVSGPQELVRGTRTRGGKGRKGLRAKAKGWRPEVDAIRQEPPILNRRMTAMRHAAQNAYPKWEFAEGSNEIFWGPWKVTSRKGDYHGYQSPGYEFEEAVPDPEGGTMLVDRGWHATLPGESLTDLFRRVFPEHKTNEQKLLDEWWGGSGVRGVYQTVSGDPGSKFEEQHTRVMRAGALIDAEVQRRAHIDIDHRKAYEREFNQTKRKVKALEKAEDEAAYEAAGKWLRHNYYWHAEEVTPEYLRDLHKRYLRESKKSYTKWDQKLIDEGNRFLDFWDNRYNYSEEMGIEPSLQSLHDATYEAKRDMWAAEVPLPQARREEANAIRAHAWDVLREIRSFGGTLDLDHFGSDSEGLTAVRYAADYLPSEWVDAIAQRQFSVRRVEEGVRASYSDSEQIIRLSDELDHAALHELVHGAEYARDGITGAEWTFYVSRVSPYRNARWEEPKKLREVLGSDAYRENEITRTDDFIDAYSGKEYNGATMNSTYEILTMGIEDLAYGNYRIVAQDEEYRQFVLGALAVL